MNKIKIWWVSVLLVGLFTSCSVIKPIAVRDSTVINYHYIDSINYIDSTIYHHLYKEIYRDYTGLLDTLNLEDSYSKAQAYIDTTNKQLKGSIATKDADIPVKIKYKEKLVYRDSIVYQKEEVPIPVEVEKKYIPKWCWWLMGINIGMIVALILWILKKYFKIFG